MLKSSAAASDCWSGTTCTSVAIEPSFLDVTDGLLLPTAWTFGSICDRGWRFPARFAAM